MRLAALKEEILREIINSGIPMVDFTVQDWLSLPIFYILCFNLHG